MTHTGTVVPRRTLRRLTAAELVNPVEIKKRNDFDSQIKMLLGDSLTLPPSDPPPLHLELADFSADVGDEDYDPIFDSLPHDEDPVTSQNAATLETPITDNLINAEVLLPTTDNKVLMGKVLRKSTDKSGASIGKFDANPLLNTTTYDVVFPDDSVQHFGANIIAQNLYNQVDENGHCQRHLDCILDYKKDSTAVTKENMFILTKSGQKRMRQSTIGWHLLVKWRDGNSEWIPLKKLKELCRTYFLFCKF